MKIFRFVKKVFFTRLIILSNLTNAIPLNATTLSCISMSNQECKARPEIVNVNSNKPIFYPFSIKTSKCSGNFNNVNDPYARICVPDVVKNLKVKAFNLMSRTNETRYIEWHETCKCECRLDAIVCNNKQHWNKDKCRCECKELIDKGVCDKGFIWNPSNFECKCNKACDFSEHLDYILQFLCFLGEKQRSYKKNQESVIKTCHKKKKTRLMSTKKIVTKNWFNIRRKR